MKLITVIGARPQFIKAAAVSSVFAKSGQIQEKVLHTGQHFDASMSDIFFEELGMAKPAFQLSIHGGGHGEMTGRMLAGIEKVLIQEKPDALLVYGDTNSTLAGALAASKLLIPVAHVEAGLRSFNKKMPEEQNRILTDHLSRWLFTPTESAVHNLKNEGIFGDSVVRSGDVMYDAALHYGKRAEETSTILPKLNLKNGEFILSTIHRAENTDSLPRLKAIFGALSQISQKMQIVLPLHPRTRQKLQAENIKIDSTKIHLIEPVGYLDMVMLEKNAALIACDSGGVQKEAFFYKVPCVTLRDETEWVELVDLGWNRVVPPNSVDTIVHGIEASLGSKGRESQPYGEGKAGEIISQTLLKSF